MQILSFFLIGLFLGMITTSAPGLLNMNIVKISKKDGKKPAYWFTLAACLILLLQICFSGYIIYRLGFSQGLSEDLKKIGLFILILLTLYFFFFANKIDKRREEKEKQTREKTVNFFMRGLGLASANVLPIPFYLFIFTLLPSYSLTLGLYQIFSLSLGAFIGSAFDFLIYIRFFGKAGGWLSGVLRYINYVIGGITGVLSLITFYQLFWG